MGMGRDVGFVSHQDDGVAVLMQLVKQRHDFGAGGGVQVPGRLISQDEGRIVDQRAGDRDSLALAAGELIGPMIDSFSELDGLKGLDCALFSFVGRAFRCR